ncbi:hypothetical protein KP509_08G041100 [Ceratopteris richardii]|uniref:Fungal lipase-type domain-containing protein n=1 Tax=Ceratopteris richardii TaxID=49495 RepID=A0A8T2UBK0_CERRI|nr:hypothetical protein KP509_08G041100 [Ceratopteris richardii]
MDSLLSKIAPLKALVPTRKTMPHEGSDPSQMQSRSTHLSVCRCPAAGSKSTSAISTNASLTQETSADPAFTPLPLPSAKSTVPAPLRFLWFRKNIATKIENKDPHQGCNPIPECADGPIYFQREESDEYVKKSLLLSAQNIGEKLLDSSVDSGGIMQEQADILDAFSQDEGSNITFSETHVDLLEEQHMAATVLSNVVKENVNSTSNKSWISKIAVFRALWPRKAHSSFPDASAPGSSSSKEEHPNLSECEGACGECDHSDCYGCSLEVPYTKTHHNKESFSKYLQDTTLSDMEEFLRMAKLCDMAYMIPDIQPSQLLRQHRLKFVTSSLEKKADIESKRKEYELQKGGQGKQEKLASDKRLTNNKSIDGMDISLCKVGGKLSLSQANDDSHLKEKGNGSLRDGSFTSEFHMSYTASQSELLVEHMIDTVEHQEGSEITNDQPLMAVIPVTDMFPVEEETDVRTEHVKVANSCPCEWFICDDEDSHTRFFAIQGSESMAAWQVNLFFEPTKFEGLDVLVHRGVYEAANALYDQLLPEVLAHFSAHGELAQVRFTGHSLGGGLATLLVLMFQIRGILPRKNILPVVTIGSPCIMCGGDNLLRELDLPQDHIQSIIMHRDIVPRAFSCDYPDHIAKILKRLNRKFQNHPCLDNQKLLFSPMGQLLILQPDESIAPSHPLLPTGYGLYFLRHPNNGKGFESAVELRAAQRAFLNLPHPLEILANPGAYGLKGAVSRDHNPRSYIKVLRVVLQHEAKRLHRDQQEQSRQMWWPSLVVNYLDLHGAFAPAICRTSLSNHGLTRTKHMFNYNAFAWGSFSIWRSHKATVSRYVRLIASKHVQIGMVFLVSIQMVIIECLHTIYVWI